jgi:hypothetical protein
MRFFREARDLHDSAPVIAIRRRIRWRRPDAYGTTAQGAKLPFVQYAIYVVHGTKQRRPIVRHVI